MIATTALAAGLGGAYAVVSAALGNHFTRASRQPVACPRKRWPAHLSMDLASRGDGVALSGWYIPSLRSSSAVILAHGRGSCKGFELEADTEPLVGAMSDLGFSVLAIDLRGHGESADGRTSFGWHERRDILGAFDWLIARGYEAGRIGVIGASMGGAAAIAAAAEEPGIAAVVTDCSFADFGQVVRAHFQRALPLGAGQILLPGTLLASRMLLGTFMTRFRPADLARRLRDRRVLTIHTTGDPVIPVDHAYQLHAAARGDLWLIPSERHVGGFAEMPATYLARVSGFMLDALMGCVLTEAQHSEHRHGAFRRADRTLA